VRAALPNDQSPNGGAANRTGLPLSIINAKVILEVPSAIDPVDACPVAPDAFPEDSPDRSMQATRLHATDAPGILQGMQSGQMKSLIGIDIPHSSKESLVKQQGFQPPPPRAQPIK
jgi:hypothetical protein